MKQSSGRPGPKVEPGFEPGFEPGSRKRLTIQGRGLVLVALQGAGVWSGRIEPQQYP